MIEWFGLGSVAHTSSAVFVGAGRWFREATTPTIPDRQYTGEAMRQPVWPPLTDLARPTDQKARAQGRPAEYGPLM